MTKILMVCLGNICRSPLAEGILKSKVDKSEVVVDSAGTGAYHVGELPDNRSISIAQINGIDITDQRARKFSRNDFENFDVIYVMDHSNYRDVVALANSDEEKSKVKMILNEVFEGENLDVPDPYYGGDHGFKNVYNMLDAACNEIIKKM